MIERLFRRTIYIKVYKNKFIIRHIENKKEISVSASEPFSTKRLLIGEFLEAENTLHKGIKKLYEGRWFLISPLAVIQPMEMMEGGLSEVEERILKEVTTGAGARKVIVWVGRELSDMEVLQKAGNV